MRINLTGVNRITRRLATAERRVYYYHRKSGKRLPDDPASPEFFAKLQELNAVASASTNVVPGTLEALIVAYKDSADYRQLRGKTRRDYARYLDVLREMWGKFPVSAFSRKHVKKLREKFSATPRTANYYIQVFRLLMTVAIEEELREDNPAARPRLLKTGEGHRPWEEDEIAAYRIKWPVETLQRVAFELILNSGQRGEDVVEMTRRHYRNGWLSVKQLKTSVRIDVPASNDLRIALDPFLKNHNGLTLLVDERGKSFQIDNFRHFMRDGYDAAGLSRDCTSHGLRYTQATVLHELGCDWETIASITGHETVAMVRKYTAQRRRARLAIAKVNRARAEEPLVNDDLQNAPDQDCKTSPGTDGETGG